MGRNTRFVGWGCGFFDFDNDGWTDLLLVNGHAFPEVDRLKIDIHYRDRAILYRNDHGKFVDISESAGPGILERHSSRGRPLRDYDNDGRWKRWSTIRTSRRRCLQLAAKPANHWIELKLEGVKSNRSAIGARVRVTAGGVRSDGGSAQRRKLSLAERSAAALRTGQRDEGRPDRNRLARRRNADGDCSLRRSNRRYPRALNPSIHHTSRCWRGRVDGSAACGIPRPNAGGRRVRPIRQGTLGAHRFRGTGKPWPPTTVCRRNVASPSSNGEYSDFKDPRAVHVTD